MPTADQIIQALDLQPLKGEGGLFRQTWILPASSGQPLATAIIYLITPDSFSALHRLDADEIFHFYLGDPCQQLVITEHGEATVTTIGSDILAGQQVQTLVPKGTWQGTKLIDGGKWALLGTTMAPGFHLDGFELASKADLSPMPEDVIALATTWLAEGA